MAHTTFGPDRLLAQTTFFDQAVLCPNLCEPSLTPKKPWPMELLFGTTCCSCLFGAMDLPARDPPYPRPPCAGVVVVVVWCVGAVCVQDFRGCVQDLGAPPDSPSAGPSPDSPSAGPPKVSPFFPSPAPIFALFVSLWGSSRVFLVVFEAPGPSNVHVWALGLSCETPAAFAKCQEQFYNGFALPLSLPKKSMTNYYKFCLYPEKSLEHNRNSTGRRPSTFGTHTFWPSLFLGCCLCCLCCS